MSVMNAYSGRQFDPMKMTTDDVILEDIAHALSLMCRGCGQIKYFYTVAQHSLNCAREAEARKLSKKLVLACLLHDASEAYISDIIRPVKSHLSNYLEIEGMIMGTILKKYGLDNLSDEENKAWKQIDDDMLDNELKVMMSGEENRSPVKLKSAPDFNEHNYMETEKTFLDKAKSLINLEPHTRD